VRGFVANSTAVGLGCGGKINRGIALPFTSTVWSLAECLAVETGKFDEYAGLSSALTALFKHVSFDRAFRVIRNLIDQILAAGRAFGFSLQIEVRPHEVFQE
jgi:hypothetical protein